MIEKNTYKKEDKKENKENTAHKVKIEKKKKKTQDKRGLFGKFLLTAQ